MKILLVYPKYPDTFWSFKHALKLASMKAAFPPLGLLTVAAMLPEAWEKKLVDMNATSLSDEDLDKLFIACCLTGLSRYDMQAEALTEFTGSPEAFKDWFKPDETWLNKYKANQLSMMEDFLFGKVSNDSRANRVKAIKDELAKNPVFDPYGSWPQFKPQ